MADYHLAQLNIGRIVAPLESPQLAGFVARLEEINALADGAPGFVWRFQTEDGNASALRRRAHAGQLLRLGVGGSPAHVRLPHSARRGYAIPAGVVRAAGSAVHRAVVGPCGASSDGPGGHRALG